MGVSTACRTENWNLPEVPSWSDHQQLRTSRATRKEQLLGSAGSAEVDDLFRRST